MSKMIKEKEQKRTCWTTRASTKASKRYDQGGIDEVFEPLATGYHDKTPNFFSVVSNDGDTAERHNVGER